MFINYLNIAIRSLLKNRVHTVINVLGLALGLACTFLIGIYAQHELSFDRFHRDAENLYRIAWYDENPQTRTPHPMAQAMVADFPEVESAVSLTPLWAAGLTREVHSLRNPNRAERYDELNILSVDTTFFDVFSFPLLKGNPKTALKSTNGGVLMSESMARKYFGNEDPIGKQLFVDGDQYLVQVVGVFKDVPANSHFHFDFLVSYMREKSLNPGNDFYSWKDFGHYNYIRLKPGTDAAALEAKLLPWIRKYISVTDEQARSFAASGFGFRLQKVTDIHLHSKLHWELEPNGNIEYIYILAAAGLLTLFIACINFMNLTTAKSTERAKEIGVRKTLGAHRNQLSLQFLSEAVVVALAAVVLSVFIMQVSLPFIQYATGIKLQINYGQYFLLLALFGILTGVAAGVYPAFYLSNIKPNVILRGKLTQSREGRSLRSGLIVFQFCMSMFLLCSSFIIYNQLNFLQRKDLGFSKDQVIVIPIKSSDGFDRFDELKNELTQNSQVVSVSASSNIPGRQFNQNPIFSVKDPEQKLGASEVFVDYDFFKTLDIGVSDGRIFQRENPADSAAFILNETAANQLFGGKAAVGQEIGWEANESSTLRGTVIGVVKDFHFQSLHEPVRPLLFILTRSTYNNVIVKTTASNIPSVLSAIEKSYHKVQPYFEFEYYFLGDMLSGLYASEQRTGSLLATFSVIAILIAAFGLFGISLLTFHQRTKELSVRKVLGASSGSLLVLLIGNFTRLILFSIVLAVPLVWWVMNKWMNNFNYKAGISLWTFVVAGVVLVAVAWLTLLYFSWRATRLNPAETLKSE